jgi:hypothetical protein
MEVVMIEVEINTEKDNEYPKLMISKDFGHIVLMDAPKRGVNIREGSNYIVGYFSEHWNMDCFEDFTGTVTLKNK